MSRDELAALDAAVRAPIRAALEGGAHTAEIVFLLTRMLPELETQGHVIGQVLASYHCAAGERDRASREVVAHG